MNNRILLPACVGLLCILAARTGLSAEEPNKSAAPPASSTIQMQIDELKAGQERLLQELQEIKSLLQGNSSGKLEMAPRPASPGIIQMNVQGEPFRGDNRAKVAIMEYSDFDCSFCATYAREIFPKIDEEYIKTGRVKYFFRDMPAREHPNAMPKAKAARCAEEQGKFWEMHDLLFATQGNSDATNLTLHARTLGLDVEKFTACIEGGKHEENIRRGVAGAKRAGVYGTPAFLIGTTAGDGDVIRTHNVLVGGESYEAIKSAIEEALKAQETILPGK